MYRYHSDGLNDFSWGCVYRNFQTVLLELCISVPSLRQCLRRMVSADKADMDYNALIGSKRHLWIEPHDLAMCIRTHYAAHKLRIKLLLFDTKPNAKAQSEQSMQRATRKKQTVKYDRLVSDAAEMRVMIVQHLRAHSVPIIMDDGEYSYLLLAIHVDDGRVSYLVGDPHYGMMYGARDPTTKWSELGRHSDEEHNVFQYGLDYGKMQWKEGKFVEQSNKTWMFLFVSH